MTDAIDLIGIHFDMPNPVYHGELGISKSGLDLMARSPYHYMMSKSPTAPAREETASQRVGTLAHLMILEPHLFEENYAVGPDVSRTTKAWKEFAEEHQGKTIIKVEEYQAAVAQSRSVWEQPFLSTYRDDLKAEVSAFWFDQATGVLCKCRPDGVIDLGDGKVILVDIKTTTSASPAAFAKQARTNAYDVQDAWYRMGYAEAAGVEVLDFLFVTVETGFPYASSICRLDDATRDSGLNTARRLLNLYAECLKADDWPCFTNINQISIRPFDAGTSNADEFSDVPNFKE